MPQGRCVNVVNKLLLWCLKVDVLMWLTDYSSGTLRWTCCGVQATVVANNGGFVDVSNRLHLWCPKDRCMCSCEVHVCCYSVLGRVSV